MFLTGFYMKAILTYLSICFLMACSLQVTAQIDAHFSQYYAYPLWLNPALTGIHDGDYRVSLNFKNQWSDISNSYSTAGASFDYSATSKLGLGITIFNQAAGDAGYNNLTGLLSSSYRIRFGQEGYQNISFGIQAGFTNRSFDQSKLQFGNQYAPGVGFDGSIPSSERFNSTSGTALNVNAGIMYFDSNPQHTVNTFAGIAMANINKPENPLQGEVVTRIPVRLTAHGGVRIRASDNLDLTPNIIYMVQGNAQEIVGGISGVLKMGRNNDFLFGESVRLQDAAITYIGLRLGDYVVGSSYDVNTSSLVQASSSRGGLELSVTYTPHKKPARVDFICPKL